MKIVLTVHHFPPKYTGGAEWRAYRTANALRARGHDVRVVCVERIDTGPANGVSWEDDEYEGVPVRRLSFNLVAAPDPFRWEYDNPWIGHHLRPYLKEYQPDVFHLIGGYLISAHPLHVACDLNIPTVVTLTDFWFLCRRILMLRSNGQVSTLPVRSATCSQCLGEEKRRYRILGHILPGVMTAFWKLRKTQASRFEARTAHLRDTLNRVDAIISPSNFLRSTFIDAGVNPDKMVFSRQGRDFANLAPELLEKTPSSRLRIGYIGQVTWHKGIHILFEAARKLPAAALSVTVYGDTTPFPKYTAQLQQAINGDERLTLAGLYRPHQVSEVFRNLDVIVVPSLWYENSPNVILEAFAHRTPVIASNLGGMAELVQDGRSGLLFAPGDAADLARQLQRLLDEPGLLSILQAGISPVKTTAQELHELEDIYLRVVTGARQMEPA